MTIQRTPPPLCVPRQESTFPYPTHITLFSRRASIGSRKLKTLSPAFAPIPQVVSPAPAEPLGMKSEACECKSLPHITLMILKLKLLSIFFLSSSRILQGSVSMTRNLLVSVFTISPPPFLLTISAIYKYDTSSHQGTLRKNHHCTCLRVGSVQQRRPRPVEHDVIIGKERES